MKNKTRGLQAVAGIVLILGLSAGPDVALAQTGGGYDLTWNTINNGGAAFISGGNYQLNGTIGQPAAGPISGGNYVLNAGFLALSQYRAFVPIAIRS